MTEVMENLMEESYEINFDEIDDDLAAFQEDEKVKLALQRGVDLKKYGRELEQELKDGENELIIQHVKNNPQVVDLHKQMQECDAVLVRMQDMLQGFQGDLGGISEEIKHLQDESLSMNIKLKNRRGAEEKLNKFLQNAALSPEHISAITSANVSELFVEAVINLGKRLKYLVQSEPPTDESSLDIAPCDTYTGQQFLPELEKLKLRSISKARDYFLSQFSALRKPKTNVQMVQQACLLKYAPLFSFIYHELPNVADELRTIYVESMGRTLYNVFRHYYNQLIKFDLVVATKNDLVVVEEAALKSIFTNKMSVNKKFDTFSLADRDKILDQIESKPILIHVAAAEGQKFPFEVILRSMLKHLSDAATNEFLFVLDFFKSSPKDTFNRYVSMDTMI
jgi:vacuolar protein sorting-associated protein 52